MPWPPSRQLPDLRGSLKLSARMKRSWFRSRPLLLILLCTFWVCYCGVGQWARNLESSGTTSDLTGGAPTVPTKNEAPVLNPRPTVLDGVFDSPPLRTIAVVLPVTQSSLPHLSDSLSGLSTIPHLGEVHLLCPENITSNVRNELRRTLSRAQSFGHAEFFVTLRRDEWTEAESALRAAWSILSNNILVLPQDALSAIDTISRGILFSGPQPPPVPFGLRGSNVSCGEKYQGFSAARFVLPPLLLPSRLRTANRSYFHLTSWEEVGAHFTQVEGVGGVVLSRATENSGICHHLNASEIAPLRLGHSHSPSSPPEPNDLFVILTVGMEDTLALLKLACEFKSRGKEVKIVEYGVSSDPIKPSDLASEGCDPAYSRVHDTRDPTLYQLLSNSPGVFLTLKEYHLPPESPLEWNARATVIRIPRRDLPHCDWIASLSIQELRNWYLPRVDISIVTNDRPSSLRRLLESLSNARYFGDELTMRVNIEQDADYETLDFVDNWDWEYGSVSIARRVIHAGLLPAIVESWYPHSNHSYGLILEDDVEVSPLFYAWLKMNLLRYRYSEDRNKSTHMFGISLYQPKVIETRPGGRAFFNPRTVFASNDITGYTTPYLSQIPCSWGAVYFPEHWREFHSYLNIRLSEALFGIDAVVVPNARSNRWSKSWKKYFIELAYLRGYVMVYPNYENFVSLSTNHLEAGSHVKGTSQESYVQKREMFRVPLMDLEGRTRLMDLPLGTLPTFNGLPVLNLFGQLSSIESLISSGQERQSEMVPTCEPSLKSKIRPDFRGLLCVTRTD